MEESMCLGKYLVATFSDIQENVSGQLGKWKDNSLSQASRTMLI